ncbi:hypothetical protein TWF481_012134 [Arthrobotrys musiformis]|uniref:Fido domain-containing protein n=1 Tax=Arthrobotrys musiformis TaxID=47236 RepID=A0AAV9VW43_9PEZI
MDSNNLPLSLANLLKSLPPLSQNILPTRLPLPPALIVSLNKSYEGVYTLTTILSSHYNSTPPDKLSEIIQQELAELIYSSNFIEYAGTDLPSTVSICKKVFANQPFQPRNIQELEVVQHAKAIIFFFTEYVVNKSPLSEDLILQTHNILCSGHDHSDGTHWSLWAGKYRTCEIAASSIDPNTGKRKKSIFIRAAAVTNYMATLIRNFNGVDMDPIELAAWVCTQFVNIHPFDDGNGRMCRILLNAVLWRYTGLIARIGEDEKGREGYLLLAGRGNRVYHEEDCEVEVLGQRSHVGLAELVVGKVRECGERVLEGVKG